MQDLMAQHSTALAAVKHHFIACNSANHLLAVQVQAFRDAKPRYRCVQPCKQLSQSQRTLSLKSSTLDLTVVVFSAREKRIYREKTKAAVRYSTVRWY